MYGEFDTVYLLIELSVAVLHNVGLHEEAGVPFILPIGQGEASMNIAR